MLQASMSSAVQWDVRILYSIFIKTSLAKRTLMSYLLLPDEDTPVFVLFGCEKQRHIWVNGCPIASRTSQLMRAQNAYLQITQFSIRAHQSGYITQHLLTFDKEALDKRFWRNTRYTSLLLLRLGARHMESEQPAETNAGESYIIL